MNKLTFKEKLGYGSASLGDVLTYNMISSYLLFFLTTAAGIRPAAAGVISIVGAVWNALFNPVMGFAADQVFTSRGRRRPVMFLFAIPLMLSLFAIFTDVPLPSAVKPFYYGLILMTVWTCYTGFFVPYLALGAAYTTDYEDRTVLRLYASFFNTAGTFLSFMFPSMAVDFMTSYGLSLGHAWRIVGGSVGLITAVSIIITVMVSGEKDPPCSRRTEHISLNLSEIFREYLSVARLKPMKHLIISSVSALICYSMALSSIVYYLTYNMGLSGTSVSMTLALRCVYGLILLPIISWLIQKLDKRGTLILFYATGIIGMVAVRLTGVHSLVQCLFMMLMLTFTTFVYWSIMPSVYYDMCDYDLLATGKSRQATIVSFQGLVEAAASGIGTLLLGVILQLAGFDGTASHQTACAESWIANCLMVIPCIFLAISAAAIWRYPVTRQVHREITEKLNRKK